MLTYTPNQDHTAQVPTERPWLLLLLTFIWLWPGILGHDPWRPDEPWVTAVVQEMLATGNYLVPALDGQAFLRDAPLYYWLGAVFAKLFSPWLMPLHDAIRLATPFCMAAGLAFAGGAGRELIGRRHGRSVVLIMIGCFGLIVTGHEMNPVVAGFTGFAAAFYALTLALRAPALGGAVLGLASVWLLLATSVLEVALVWLVALALPVFAAWRSKRHAITLAMGLLIALPLSALWLVGFMDGHPLAFKLWLDQFALGPFNGFGQLSFFHEPGYYPKTVLWYAFPAWPLAVWTLYRARRFDQPRIQLPLLAFAVTMLVLTLSSRQSSESAMPLLLPLAILAAAELDTLRRGAAAFLNWFGLMTFGLFGLLVWLGWLAMNYGWPERLAGRAHYFSPYYTPHISLLAAGFAMLATLCWLWAVTRRHLRGRQAVTNWAAGITLFWGLGMSLWLPWLDAAKSYRPVVAQMMAALPDNVQCVATADNNRMARLSWQYYAGLTLKPHPVDAAVPCDWQLVVRTREEGLAEPGWQVLWSGGRPRDKNEQYG
ncbi:ArnT family glycosyltransferase, partial [Craterilacuibacter sp.]|uniref:ArnT family glycosyltransferase n=1 Tax=Craterilacuibacter sp. TaxID=2870909 RepID=UPI003F2D9740